MELKLSLPARNGVGTYPDNQTTVTIMDLSTVPEPKLMLRKAGNNQWMRASRATQSMRLLETISTVRGRTTVEVRWIGSDEWRYAILVRQPI
jgi:hypothetical protein